jgi:hydrogenase expression/formation protein HypC
MTVMRVDEVRGLALCSDQEGARSTVETALVDPVAPGDVLLVHAGTALTRIRRRRQAPPTIPIPGPVA